MAILAECPRCRTKQSLRNKKCRCGENIDKAKKSGRVKFHVRYRTAEGRQKSTYAGVTVSQAKAIEGKIRAQKYENPGGLQEYGDKKMTFRQLTEQYFGYEKVKSRKYYETLIFNLNSFNEIFGEKTVGSVKPVDIENYQIRRKQQGYSDSYIDQQVGAARTMINKMCDNDIIGPEALKVFKRVGKMLKKNSNARSRILAPTEYNTLMCHLPSHLKPIVATAYFTGMRKGEILNLTWKRVSLKRRTINLLAEETKDGEARDIPITKELYTMLKSLPVGIGNKYVFLYRGKKLSDIRAGLMRGCKKADIPYGREKENGFVFHDLRHTFNTNMRKAGVPESVIMAITGHSTREMFDRYNTVDEQDAKKAMTDLIEFLAVTPAAKHVSNGGLSDTTCHTHTNKASST